MLRKGNEAMSVVAILTADIHLSENPPVARSAEPNWLKAMARPLDEICSLSDKHKCPVVIAGDLFDCHDPSPRLVNFAMRHWPRQNVYAVPGQHDLPHHNYQDVKKTAYWTLVEAKRIVNLHPGLPVEYALPQGPIRLHGFPWKEEVKPLVKPHDLLVEIAVVHEMVWDEKEPYPDAPGRLRDMRRKYKGYDVVVCGDNHRPFYSKLAENSVLWNCGSLMRRRADQKDFRPSVGLLSADGTVKRYYLDVSKDKLIDKEEKPENGEADDSCREFMETLAKSADAALDYAEAVKRVLEQERHRPEVRRVVMECLEKGREK